MRAWTRFVAVASILAAVVAAAGRVARGATADPVRISKAGDVESRLLDALNDRIQERFRTVDNRRFGYSRIATLDRTPHTFDAENVRETSVLHDLEAAQLRVVMYLAGREVLRTDDPATARPFLRMRLIRGPVVVTPGLAGRASADGSTAFPAPLDLLPESRNALLAFGEGDSTRFVQGDWTFIARPVRATDAVCLNCHRESSPPAPGNSLTLGDPLGAVLYGYQPIR